MSLMFTIKSAAVTGLFWVDFFFFFFFFVFVGWIFFFFGDSDLSKIVLLLGAMDCG